MLILAVIFMFVFLIVMKQSLLLVPSNQVRIQERLGKFEKVLEPGIHVLLPFVDRITHEFAIDAEKLTLPEQRVNFRDSALAIQGTLTYRVIDPHSAAYGVEDLGFALLTLCSRVLPSVIAQSSARAIFELKPELERLLVHSMNESVAAWGVQLERANLEIRETNPRAL